MKISMTRNDAICVAFTYFFADLGVRGHTVARRILGDDLFFASDKICDLYTALVEDIASQELPEEWKPRYDYWGGKCLSSSTHWSDPKGGTIMAGQSGRYMAATSEQAIRDEMRGTLEDLEAMA